MIATHKHKNGGLYRELMRGYMESTREAAVVYQGVNHPFTTWIRVASEFDDRKRFMPLYANGAPMYTKDGMMLDDKGCRSIFDDVDE